MTCILDTNVLLRYLVGDNPLQQKQAISWFFEGEEGKRKIIVKPIVIAEACFVLESFYKKTKKEITEAMEIFLTQKWLKIEDRAILLTIWPLYTKGLHFVDSYLLSWSKANKAEILTFDKKIT